MNLLEEQPIEFIQPIFGLDSLYEVAEGLSGMPKSQVETKAIAGKLTPLLDRVSRLISMQLGGIGIPPEPRADYGYLRAVIDHAIRYNNATGDFVIDVASEGEKLEVGGWFVGFKLGLELWHDVEGYHSYVVGAVPLYMNGIWMALSPAPEYYNSVDPAVTLIQLPSSKLYNPQATPS